MTKVQGRQLSPGADGQVLTTVSGEVAWATPSGGGSIDANAMGVVSHGTNASAARPAGYSVVTWIGSVQPTNAVAGDVWLDSTYYGVL